MLGSHEMGLASFRPQPNRGFDGGSSRGQPCRSVIETQGVELVVGAREIALRNKE